MLPNPGPGVNPVFRLGMIHSSFFILNLVLWLLELLLFVFQVDRVFLREFCILVLFLLLLLPCFHLTLKIFYQMLLLVYFFLELLYISLLVFLSLLQTAEIFLASFPPYFPILKLKIITFIYLWFISSTLMSTFT